MLHAYEIVLEHGHLALSGLEDFVQLVRELRLGAATHMGQGGDGIFQAPFKSWQGDAELFAKWSCESVRLGNERRKQMLAGDLGIFLLGG